MSQTNQTAQSFGRMELAQQYFPNIQPRSAWLKMRALMLEIPDLSAFATQKRRTFLPNEVNIIYQCLGHPWVPLFSAFSGPFQALWLSSEQTPTFLGGNHHFPRSKLRLFSEPFSHLYSYHTICKQILSKAWHRDNRDSSFKAIPIIQNTSIIYIIYILYI